jgi:hypothetical protein
MSSVHAILNSSGTAREPMEIGHRPVLAAERERLSKVVKESGFKLE